MSPPGVIRINRKHVSKKTPRVQGRGRPERAAAGVRARHGGGGGAAGPRAPGQGGDDCWLTPHYCQYPGRADPVSAGRRQEGGLGRGGGAG